METIGYARTSTADQVAGLDAQVRDLAAAGATKIYQEQTSSVGQRKQLDACLAYLRPGDLLIVTKPDRLARSTRDLLKIVEDLAAQDIGLLILSMGGKPLDTRDPTSKLILTILGGVSAWEREIMLERQREGIQRAKNEGKYLGGQKTTGKHAALVAYMHDQGSGADQIAVACDISRASVYRLLAAARA